MNFIRNEEENAVFGAGSYVNYKYNRKELQETGMYDYGWRMYMPDIGRWYGMDQLSEMYHSLSPYNYVANNPVNFVNPDGRCIKNEQGDKCDDSPGGANNPYLIEAAPSSYQLNNFLSGHGFNVVAGFIGGGGLSWSPSNGTATGLGFYSPQIGVSYNYTSNNLIWK